MTRLQSHNGNGRRQHSHNSQLPPYILNKFQRKIVLVIHQRGPQSVDGLRTVDPWLLGAGKREQLTRAVENLTPNFLSPRGDGSFMLTPRALEIAQNIEASSGDPVKA